MEAPVALRIRILRFSLLTITIAVVVVTGIGFDDMIPLSGLFADFRPQYCVVLALLAVGAIILKRRAAFLLSILGLYLNWHALAPYAQPWHDENAGKPAGRKWSIVSINLDHESRAAARVIAYLRRIQPDIVIFEEVSPLWESELETLRDLYPHRSIQSREDSFGLAVFSKSKPVEMTIRTAGRHEGELAVFGTWESESQQFGIVGVHLQKPLGIDRTRSRHYYLQIARAWPPERGPLILIGNFNATPWSASLPSLVQHSHFRNVNQGTVFGATWNYWKPYRLLLDHAFLSNQWQLLHHEVGPDLGLDHRPLLIEASLRPGG